MLIMQFCLHVGGPAWPRRLAGLLGAIIPLTTGGSSSAAAAGQAPTHPTTASSPAINIRARAEPAPAPRQRTTGATPVRHAEQALAEQATLPEILRLVLAKNPMLEEARQRVRAARELTPAAARLPDPELEYQLWAQPLARPYALDEAQMHMFGVRQTFPAPGSLSARGEAALGRANIAEAAGRAREQDLVGRVRGAYAEYCRTEREYQIHLEHAALGQQAVDAVQAQYQGARGTQRDVLRARLELSRLHSDVAALNRDRHTARALLNTLMARPPDAPLGPPAALVPASVEVRLAELERVLAEQRPEIAAAKSAIRVRESELDGARAVANWPSFMLGLQYMYMPAEREPHAYGLMFSMSLPWFNARHAEEVRAAEAQLSAEESALAGARLAARYELYAAAERLQGARESFRLIEDDLLPQAQQSYESVEAAYRGGQSDSLGLFDALRSLLDVRIERERALVLVDTAAADIERAVGGSLTAASLMTEHE